MNAERRGSVAYTDKERLQSLQSFLPESQVRDFVHQMQTSFPRYFGDYATTYATYRREIQDSIVFAFDDTSIQEAYVSFNTASDDLYRLALAIVVMLDDGRLDTSEIYFIEGVDDVVVPESEEVTVEALSTLADAYEEAYETLLNTAVLIGKPSVSLAGKVIVFDDALPVITVDTQEARLPAFSHEHYLARVMFGHRAGETVDWSEVYDALNPGGAGDRTPEKEAQSVRDAVKALNVRIQEMVGTTDKLITYQKKTVRRNF
jgi:hypothetical protein